MGDFLGEGLFGLGKTIYEGLRWSERSASFLDGRCREPEARFEAWV